MWCKKVIQINARSKDMTVVTINGHEVMNGYAPGAIVGCDNETLGGDHVIITYCGECGQILNGNFPVDIADCWLTDYNGDCEDCSKNKECNHAE